MKRSLLISAALTMLVVIAALLAASFAVGLILDRGRAESAFPGVSGKIAFVSFRDGQGDIYAMNADGTEQTRLTVNPASDYEPVWSPDGTSILFRTYRVGIDEIYVMNADGSGQTNVTENPALDIHPAWSPDGSKILFVSTRNDPYYASCDYWCYEIYTMNLDGSGVTRLTYNSDVDFSPVWSPDGSKIAFMSNRASGYYDVFVMNADGSSVTNLTNSLGGDADPDWSPDGSKIAFRTDRDGDWEVYVMNADGSGVTRLTNSPGWDSAPAWSPDGSKIAFESGRDGDSGVYVMNSDGSQQTRLTYSAGGDIEPDWQPLPVSPPPTSTPTPASPTPPPPTLTPTPTRPPGVGGQVKLPPAAIAAESGAPAGGSGWTVGAYAVLAAGTALAVGGWYARRRRLR
jgi:Tol biopolymer transport system component